MINLPKYTFLLGTMFFVAGIATADEPKDPVGGAPVVSPEPKGAIKSAHGAKVAMASLTSKSGSEATGDIAFFKIPEGILVEASIRNAGEGAHGFHVHEKGDCSAADAASAGGHLNPSHKAHGKPGAGSHLGDLGNIHVGKDKTGTLSIVLKNVKAKAISEIIGKAVVLHESEDDLKSQPAGNSGKRIACGVVEKATDTE